MLDQTEGHVRVATPTFTIDNYYSSVTCMSNVLTYVIYANLVQALNFEPIVGVAQNVRLRIALAVALAGRTARSLP